MHQNYHNQQQNYNNNYYGNQQQNYQNYPQQQQSYESRAQSKIYGHKQFHQKMKALNKPHKVEIYFRLTNIPGHIQNTQISLREANPTNNGWGSHVIGTTELSGSSPNASFSNPIKTEFAFHKKQTMLATLLMNNGQQKDATTFQLGELVGSSTNSISLRFPKSGIILKAMFEGSADSIYSQGMTDQALFSSYLAGSLDISVVVCIDFTASNKDPDLPGSLHAQNGYGMNDYQSTISSVCDILLNYDKDKLIQVYGFGGKPRFPGFEGTSHFFPVSGDWDNCAGVGVEGVFNIYTTGLDNIDLSGPTFFAPMLRDINEFTKANFKQNKSGYTILLIITDGCIHDMNETIQEVVNGSVLPLSIIIVGVGSADFTNMQILDSDEAILTDDQGRRAARDIIQFVPFNKFRQLGPQRLAEEVLEEVPRQVVQFMQAYNLDPSNGLAKEIALRNTKTRMSGMNGSGQSGGQSRQGNPHDYRRSNTSPSKQKETTLYGEWNQSAPQSRTERTVRNTRNNVQTTPFNGNGSWASEHRQWNHRGRQDAFKKRRETQVRDQRQATTPQPQRQRDRRKTRGNASRSPFNQNKRRRARTPYERGRDGRRSQRRDQGQQGWSQASDNEYRNRLSQTHGGSSGYHRQQAHHDRERRGGGGGGGGGGYGQQRSGRGQLAFDSMVGQSQLYGGHGGNGGYRDRRGTYY